MYPTLSQPSAYGNSKSEQPFYPTLRSKMAKIKDNSKQAGPKKMISKVSSELGGVIGATDPCVTKKLAASYEGQVKE